MSSRRPNIYVSRYSYNPFQDEMEQIIIRSSNGAKIFPGKDDFINNSAETGDLLVDHIIGGCCCEQWIESVTIRKFDKYLPNHEVPFHRFRMQLIYIWKRNVNGPLPLNIDLEGHLVAIRLPTFREDNGRLPLTIAETTIDESLPLGVIVSDMTGVTGAPVSDPPIQHPGFHSEMTPLMRTTITRKS